MSKFSCSTIQINDYIDHTVLKPTTVESDVLKLCDEAKQYSFVAVCVPPNYVKFAKLTLLPSLVKVATVIGFPFGYSNINSKIAETSEALDDGADEIDMVANISAIKSHNWDYLKNEVNSILRIVRDKSGKKLKVIIESGILTDEEIIACCGVYGEAGIDFLKTSTGYAEKGASVEAVLLFRSHLPDSVQIKASGGIRDRETALKMIEAGATRIGCSAGVAIVTSNCSSTGSAY